MLIKNYIHKYNIYTTKELKLPRIKFHQKTAHIKIRKLKFFRKFYKLFEIFYKFFINATRIYIKITSNNMFCTCVHKNKTIHVGSAGKYRIHSRKFSKKKSAIEILKKFLKIINFIYKAGNAFKIKINFFKSVKYKFIRLLSRFFKKKHLFITILNFKCFNGCKVKKKARLKRQKFVLLK